MQIEVAQDDYIETEQCIPVSLMNTAQWLTYRVDDGDKIPMAPVSTPTPSGVRSPGDWTTFLEAQSAVEESQQIYSEEKSLDGVGFVVTEDDPFVFVDLDHHIDEEGMDSLAEEWLDSLDTWTEVSQSGEGAHAIVEAPNYDNSGYKCRDDANGIEVYTDSRFMAATCDTMQEYPTFIRENCDELTRLSEEFLQKSTSSVESVDISAGEDTLDVSVSRVIETACLYDDKFAGLHNGKSYHSDDTSRDDISYLIKCYFWAQGDTAMVKQMANQSNRVRSKWTDSRGDSTWFQEQLEEAKSFQNDTFSGRYVN